MPGVPVPIFIVATDDSDPNDKVSPIGLMVLTFNEFSKVANSLTFNLPPIVVLPVSSSTINLLLSIPKLPLKITLPINRVFSLTWRSPFTLVNDPDALISTSPPPKVILPVVVLNK